MFESITVIITGGTIDSILAESNASNSVTESILPRYFEGLKLERNTEFQTLFLKDSRDVTHDDLKRICEAVDASANDKVLITHGTYTMPVTARYLEQNMRSHKAVVLTGSMVPLKESYMSDAGFNLGFAIGFLDTLSSGVRIAFNGRVFEASNAAKDTEKGRFVSLEE